MIRRNAERIITKGEHIKGGPGSVSAAQILNSVDEFYGKGRLFNHITLEKNCGVGWHVHEGDGEVYYIIRGKGEYSDNGVISEVSVGDVCVANDGEGHYITNLDEEPLELIALILFS